MQSFMNSQVDFDMEPFIKPFLIRSRLPPGVSPSPHSRVSIRNYRTGEIRSGTSVPSFRNLRVFLATNREWEIMYNPTEKWPYSRTRSIQYPSVTSAVLVARRTPSEIEVYSNTKGSYEGKEKMIQDTKGLFRPSSSSRWKRFTGQVRKVLRNCISRPVEYPSGTGNGGDKQIPFAIDRMNARSFSM